jgi:hypothetical protein
MSLLDAATPTRHRPKRPKDNIEQRRADAETQFGSPVVVQQMILPEISEQPES